MTGIEECKKKLERERGRDLTDQNSGLEWQKKIERVKKSLFTCEDEIDSHSLTHTYARAITHKWVRGGGGKEREKGIFLLISAAGAASACDS